VFDISLSVKRISKFIDNCKKDPDQWIFSSTLEGPETLYASCFVCMLYHYLGILHNLSSKQKMEWADYLNSWQDPNTGLFIGPELAVDELSSRKHSYEHISQHLTAHVLPALSLLGSRPKYPLTFAHPFLNLSYLSSWLEERDWHDAWLEGNNLIFVAQFLIYLREVEGFSNAQAALDLYFEWLDKEVDPSTGLWGSNGFCSNANALYGGYHQLLAYYYEKRPILYPERLVDVALSLQHADGGFNPGGGGGACEDTDAIDILVNMYKRVDYKRPQIRIALRQALIHILERQMPDGGFVYHLDKPFIHMGVQKTASLPNHSNLFPTWFRVHTLALISEILTDEPISQRDWRFNDQFSMGWHQTWNKSIHRLNWQERTQEQCAKYSHKIILRGKEIYRLSRSIGASIKRKIMKRVYRVE